MEADSSIKWWMFFCDRPPQHPQTPEERIAWQEQIRMIHLRSHLNQLAEKVKHANYVVDKTRWGTLGSWWREGKIGFFLSLFVSLFVSFF